MANAIKLLVVVLLFALYAFDQTAHMMGMQSLSYCKGMKAKFARGVRARDFPRQPVNFSLRSDRKPVARSIFCSLLRRSRPAQSSRNTNTTETKKSY